MATSNVDPRPLFMITSHSYKISSISSGGRVSVTRTNFGITDPDGYSLAGVRRFTPGSNYLNVYRLTPLDSTVMRIMNQYGDAMSNVTARIELLWVKSEFAG